MTPTTYALELGGITDAKTAYHRLNFMRSRLALKLTALPADSPLLVPYRDSVQDAQEEYDEIILSNRASLRVVEGGRTAKVAPIIKRRAT